MNCPTENHKPELLVAYAANQLDLETSLGMQQHLAGCDACRSFVAAQGVVWRALDAWEAPAVSAGFDRQLYKRIEAATPYTWFERLVAPLRPMPMRQILPLTATAGLLLMAGFLVEHPAQQVPVAPRVDTVHATQVERTLDDLELLRQFSTAESAESAHPDAM